MEKYLTEFGEVNHEYLINNISEIPKQTELVYILTCNKKAIVVGRGKFNRAKVIFDDSKNITKNHIKSFFVRIYHLFGNENDIFERFIIKCNSKTESSEIESKLHNIIGGNSRLIPNDIETKLFYGITNPIAEFCIKAAKLSSFSGLADIFQWRKEGIIPENAWDEINNKLKLN